MSINYKLKKISFLGRDLPIILQNENGPCPLIALCNVLLLRNQIKLSPDSPDVSQDRLVHLVANHLLECNSSERVGAEFQANFHQNIADAVELLPKLTTGVDVNIQFHDIRGFEFTDVIAVFDLLDVQLVHGWLVDPQDQETAACIGKTSYNALIERLVSLTGAASSPQPPHAAAPPSVHDTDAKHVQSSSTLQGDTASPPAVADSNVKTLARDAKPAPVESSPPDHAAAAMHAKQDVEKQLHSQQIADDQGFASLGPEFAQELEAALAMSKNKPDVPQETAATKSIESGSPPKGAEVTGNITADEPAAALFPPELVNEGSGLEESFVLVGHEEAAGHDEQDGEIRFEPIQAAEACAAAHHAAAELPVDKAVTPGAATPTTAGGAIKPAASAEAETSPAETEHASEDTDVGTGEVLNTKSGTAAALARVSSPAVAPKEPCHPETAKLGTANAATPEDSATALTEPNQRKKQPAVEGDPKTSVQQAAAPAKTGSTNVSGDPAQELPREAYVIQAFLDNTSSQLTEHGLVSLHQGLKPRQLAVFFRNNHFSTAFKYEDAIYILVTDQGYLHERDVVWEKLDAIDGDTLYVGSSLKKPEEVDQRAAEEQASLDYALALQLQQQEESNAAAWHAHQQQEQQQPQPPPPPLHLQRGSDCPTGRPVEGQYGQYGRYSGHHRPHRPPHGSGHGRRKNCSIM